jgi:hypothetical protein
MAVTTSSREFIPPDAEMFGSLVPRVLLKVATAE